MMKKNVASEVYYGDSGSASPHISQIEKSESSKLSFVLQNDMVPK